MKVFDRIMNKLDDLIKGIETEADQNRKLDLATGGDYDDPRDQYGNTEQKLESLQRQIDDLTALVKVLAVQCTSSPKCNTYNLNEVDRPVQRSILLSSEEVYLLKCLCTKGSIPS
jgi:hypothetical protein